MIKYYLNLRRGEERIVDPEGAQFLSLLEAREEAVAAIRQIMSEMVLNGQRPRQLAIEITGEAGHVAMTVSLDDAFDD